MNSKKVILGQFFTRNEIWLRPQIKQFIIDSACKIAYDPFAGNGDLLKVASKLQLEVKGLDIDTSLGWEYNDSLLSIPHIPDGIIITNPPYISNYSASRKKVLSNVKNYFDNSCYDDVYLIALDKMLEAEDYVVAIIPETFINSVYKQKQRLYSVTVLEENPFVDTDTPVIVACFDKRIKSLKEVKIYKNDDYVGDLQFINDKRIEPQHIIPMTFNDKNGWLGLRAIDLTDISKQIYFDYKDNIDYDWDKGIKVSSRLYSLIDIDIEDKYKKDFIQKANSILTELRNNTQDIILSPFKGNMKNGKRRRRLDFRTARAILEKAYESLNIGDNYEKQLRLF